jgi:hypothetical protein
MYLWRTPTLLPPLVYRPSPDKANHVSDRHSMAISQQLLHSQLSLAHCICQQLPADSRIRHRITQLLEVALDLAICADTPLGPWQQWGHTPVGPSYSACPAQSFPAGASPRQQQTTTTTATAACVNRRCRLYARRIRLPQRKLQCTRPCHIVKEVQQQDGQQQSSHEQDSQQQGPADPTNPRPTPGSAPPKASPAPSRFSAQEAEVHGIAGMSQQEVSVLAAAVRGSSAPTALKQWQRHWWNWMPYRYATTSFCSRSST